MRLPDGDSPSCTRVVVFAYFSSKLCACNNFHPQVTKVDSTSRVRLRSNCPTLQLTLLVQHIVNFSLVKQELRIVEKNSDVEPNMLSNLTQFG